MTKYVNVDTRVNGRYPKTKRDLRVALAEAPETVEFSSNSMYDSLYTTGDNVPEGHTLMVVGPDPYRDRRWYGSVTLGKNGKPVLK